MNTKNLNNEYSGDLRILAGKFCGIGDNHYQCCRYHKAAKAYERSLSYYRQAGDIEAEANLSRYTGRAYYQVGNYFKAMKLLNRAIEIYERIGKIQSLAGVYIDISHVYFQMGQFERGNQALEQAGNLLLQHRKESPALQQEPYKTLLDNPEQHEKYLIGKNDCKGLATEFLLRELGIGRTGDACSTAEPNDAMKLISSARLLFEEIGDFGGTAFTYMRTGDLLAENGEFDPALFNYHHALKLAEECGDLSLQATILGSIIMVHEKKGADDLALKLYDRQFDLYEMTGDIQSQAYSAYYKGSLLKNNRRPEQALSCYEKAIELLDRFRSRTVFSRMKQTFFVRFYSFYESVARFMLENRYFQNAFKHIEAMKARTFLDRLAEENKNIDTGISQELLEKQDRLICHLSRLSKELEETPDGEIVKRKRLLETYRTKNTRLEDLMIEMAVKNPAYAAMRYPEPISVQQLQEYGLEIGQLAVRYYLGRDHAYAFLISADSFQVLKLDASPGTIEVYTRNFNYHTRALNIEKASETGKQLYDTLFEPFLPMAEQKEEIIIIPDGNLAAIPFEALVSDMSDRGHPVYLVEKFRIKYIQSASVLGFLKECPVPENTSGTFLGFGDPVYDFENFFRGEKEKGVERTENTMVTLSDDQFLEFRKKTGSMQRGDLLDRLAGSGLEVAAIGEIFQKNGKSSLIYTRLDAREEFVKRDDINRYEYIHFACHGILTDRYQALVFTQTGGGSAVEDGYLTLYDVMKLNLNARLVVLSACRTQGVSDTPNSEKISGPATQIRRAEGVTGMTRAFMHAGAASVIASLWNVDDEGTRQLMVAFYKNILEKNLSISESLRQAKLKLLHDNRFANPKYWSPFVLYGN